MDNAFASLPHGVKWVVDLTSVAALVGSLASILPPIASALTVICMTIRICESPMVRAWLRRRKERR
jgi:hypothetical protein